MLKFDSIFYSILWRCKCKFYSCFIQTVDHVLVVRFSRLSLHLRYSFRWDDPIQYSAVRANVLISYPLLIFFVIKVTLGLYSKDVELQS